MKPKHPFLIKFSMGSSATHERLFFTGHNLNTNAAQMVSTNEKRCSITT